MSLNPSAPSAKTSKSTTTAPLSNSSSQSLSTASRTESGSGESAESGSSSDDLTRSVLYQSRSTARRRPGSDVLSATPDPSPAAQAVSNSPMNTSFEQGLSRSPSPSAPEPRYLSYSSTPVAVVPVIDIQDDVDSGDMDVSLTRETQSETGSVSPPPESTVLSDLHLSDSNNSITIPTRQVANRGLALVDFDNLPPLQQPRDR